MSDSPAPDGPLRILCLEDVPQDAELIQEMLTDEGFDIAMDVASDRVEYAESLKGCDHDIILADYTLPDFDAPAALEMALDQCPDTPFICVSGTIGEDRAVELLKLGATDYVLKDRMGRLGFAIRRALDSERQEKARRASEALNRLLVENMGDVLWVMDPEANAFVYVSPSVERLRGFTAEEVMAQPADASMTPESAKRVRDGLTERIEAFRAGDPRAVTNVTEVDQPCKDGSIVQTEVVTTFTTNARGGIDIIGVTRDATARKRVEAELAEYRAHLEDVVEERTERLRHANLELEEASRAKSEFLARMSHELRTPLNSIIGFSEVMLMGMTGELNEEQARQAGMINRSGKQLLGLISDILDLSKVEAGSMVAVSEPFDACALVDEVATSVAVQVKERGLTFTAETPAGPLSLSSDERMVRQILLNLVSNALKFTDRGSVTVEVTASPDSMVFAVRDTGRGISPEHLAHIFDEFWQVPDTDATHRGTGLGLAISSKMAALLGGDLTVESSLGEGSTFRLTVPRGQAA
jgi:two-component system, sensor histidine kinase and response regulator